jgi:hypothetical protein
MGQKVGSKNRSKTRSKSVGAAFMSFMVSSWAEAGCTGCLILFPGNRQSVTARGNQM